MVDLRGSLKVSSPLVIQRSQMHTLHCVSEEYLGVHHDDVRTMSIIVKMDANDSKSLTSSKVLV